MPDSEPLGRGANTTLTGSTCDLTVSGVRPGTVDLLVFQVTGERVVRTDDDFVFFNQPESPEGAVRLTAGDALTADLSRVPGEIETLVVAVALDADTTGTLADIAGLGVRATSGGTVHPAPATGLTTERAAVLVEVYRRAGQWKLRNVSAGWNGGLPDLVRAHGVSVDDAPAPAPAGSAPSTGSGSPVGSGSAVGGSGLPVGSGSAAGPAPAGIPAPASGVVPAAQPVQSTLSTAKASSAGESASGSAGPAPSPSDPWAGLPGAGSLAPAADPWAGMPGMDPPSAQTGTIDLGKKSGAINLAKGQRVSIEKSATIIASISWPPATDYDVYALVRYRDGHIETVSTFGTHEDPTHTMVTADGAVRHTGDVRRGSGRTAEETIEIRLNPQIVAVVPVVYSAQSNGAGSFRKYKVSMAIDNGTGTRVQVDAADGHKSPFVYTCVPGIVLNTENGVTVQSLEQYSKRMSERRPVLNADLTVTMDQGPLNKFK